MKFSNLEKFIIVIAFSAFVAGNALDVPFYAFILTGAICYFLLIAAKGFAEYDKRGKTKGGKNKR